MAAIAGTMFFLTVLGFALWTMFATIRPRLGRIAFLLGYDSAIGAELPPRPRAGARSVPTPAAGQGRPSLRIAA
ncbi:hypothetical protein [Sphingomonas sp.]|uniref:hypothetical protein n=1 Tax=Sphingomonas sp. TaxID=28214 RepID=UPI001B195FAD|nr:hypothetical protein [Sphingomonas sp.]MBO9711930.1 hypothetical protein [Sphingomonas sp.]